jgi:ElaB/YqjD/DUF883 family membrane-anchored ribosome-binding protein
MDTTLNADSSTPHAEPRTGKNGLADLARRSRKASPQEVTGLLTDVQELLERLTHIADPEISRLRSRIEEGVSSAKLALVGRTEQIQRQAREALTTGDRYVRDRPWQSIGVAAAVGLVAGFLVARR